MKTTLQKLCKRNLIFLLSFSELYLIVSKLANALHADDLKIILVVPPLAMNDMA